MSHTPCSYIINMAVKLMIITGICLAHTEPTLGEECYPGTAVIEYYALVNTLQGPSALQNINES